MTDREPLRVVVLCSGNIGRSPLAAVMLQAALADRLGTTAAGLVAAGIEVSSAGTDAPEGHGASKRGIPFAASRDLDLRPHRATRLTAEMADRADIIYGMDNAQVDGVRAVAGAAVAKTRLWEGEGSEIPDPNHESDAYFVEIAERIERSLPDRVDEILEEHARRGWS